jgi:hypothetical protein
MLENVRSSILSPELATGSLRLADGTLVGVAN